MNNHEDPKMNKVVIKQAIHAKLPLGPTLHRIAPSKLKSLLSFFCSAETSLRSVVSIKALKGLFGRRCGQQKFQEEAHRKAHGLRGSMYAIRLLLGKGPSEGSNCVWFANIWQTIFAAHDFARQVWLRLQYTSILSRTADGPPSDSADLTAFLMGLGTGCRPEAHEPMSNAGLG